MYHNSFSAKCSIDIKMKESFVGVIFPDPIALKKAIVECLSEEGRMRIDLVAICDGGGQVEIVLRGSDESSKSDRLRIFVDVENAMRIRDGFSAMLLAIGKGVREKSEKE
jgi:hypothetical protein